MRANYLGRNVPAATDRLSSVAPATNRPQVSRPPIPQNQPTVPFSGPSTPPPTGANGIAGAFQGINPARAGYDVGTAAIMANQRQGGMPSQIATGTPEQQQQVTQLSAAQQQAQQQLQAQQTWQFALANQQAQQTLQSALANQQAQSSQTQQKLIQRQQDLQNMIRNAPAQSGLNTQSGADYSKLGLSPELLAARQAYDQQQSQALTDFQNQFANASPNQLASLDANFRQQQQMLDTQFNQQNPGFAQAVNASRMSASPLAPLQGGQVSMQQFGMGLQDQPPQNQFAPQSQAQLPLFGPR